MNQNQSNEFYIVDELERGDNCLTLDFRNKETKISEDDKLRLSEINELIGS